MQLLHCWESARYRLRTLQKKVSAGHLSDIDERQRDLRTGDCLYDFDKAPQIMN